jgi:hypothetical protein
MKPTFLLNLREINRINKMYGIKANGINGNNGSMNVTKKK